MEIDYFIQKIYEISRVPKSSLEKIEENQIIHNKVRIKRQFLEIY